jgi:hypothetical protein
VRVLTPRLPATLALIALLLSTTGCSPELAPPTATPSSPAAAPLFASDEEALAAAEAAFDEYLATINRVLQEGGANPERVRPLVSDPVWESDFADADRWQKEGWTSAGNTTLESIQLQQIIDVKGRGVQVVTYNCLSNRQVDVIDRNGKSVVRPDRALEYIVEAVVAFETLTEWTIDSYEQIETVDSCDS